jgi:hypothetical protein
LPITTTIGGETKFWKLYDKIQDITYEEVNQKLPMTNKTLWAFAIWIAIAEIRSYYYHKVIKYQLSEELLAELEKCFEHYIKLWDIAIDEIDKGIKICQLEEPDFIISKLHIGKRNLELRRAVVKHGGVNNLIAILRRSPIKDKDRGTLDIYMGHYSTLFNNRVKK